MTETKTDEPVEINLTKLIEYAREGRQEVLPLLKKALDERPSLWQNFGNMAYQAQAHWLELIAREDLYFKESIARHTATMRAELAGTDSSALEMLQIERIVALALQLGFYETVLAKYEAASDSERIVDHLYERCSVADRRLQQAIVNLAKIRKLLPGVLKVDVVISGQIETKANETSSTNQETPSSNGTTRITVPQNRIKDLLAAASAN